VKFVTTKKYDNKFVSPLSFVAVFGSGIRDPESGMGKNQDPGSGIKIPDPQHWFPVGLRSDFSERFHHLNLNLAKYMYPKTFIQ
jgi:hypothetical protein